MVFVIFAYLQLKIYFLDNLNIFLDKKGIHPYSIRRVGDIHNWHLFIGGSRKNDLVMYTLHTLHWKSYWLDPDPSLKTGSASKSGGSTSLLFDNSSPFIREIGVLKSLWKEINCKRVTEQKLQCLWLRWCKLLG